MQNYHRFLYLLSIVIVVVIAVWLRLRAVDLLPIDFDEDDYLAAGQRYAQAITARDLGKIINYDFNYEHPPLTKIVYGLAILPLPEAPLIPELPSTTPPATSLPEPHFQMARLTSATISVAQVLALAIFNPLAGLFLAIHTWQIKYTSQIMLEPLPSLMSTLAVLFYVKSREISKTNVWQLLSAVALGVTAASKYPYCIAGIAIVADWLWTTRPPHKKMWRSPAALVHWLGPVVGWGLISIVIFFIANPRLWNTPFSRLAETIFFHGDYAQSEHVRRAGFPIWQPFVWLFGSVPWHPGVFVVSLDLPITLLAAFGVKRLWPKQPVFVIWLAVALSFLLVWPTKWPQYILILTAPLVVAASAGFQAKVWEPFLVWVRHIRAGKPRRKIRASTRTSSQEFRRALPWLLPGAIGLGIIALYPLIYQVAMTLTDFNNISIRDGINGGMWREVWRGLTGQVEPVTVDIFATVRPTAKEVHYAGPGVLLRFFSGLGADVLFFNVMWTVLSVALQTTLGVAAALLIHQRSVHLKDLWRAIFILPWAIPEFVGAVVWLRIFEPRFGWLNLAALPAGIVLPEWLDNPASALPVLLVAATWYGFPFIMLAVTASLKLIPADVYDASAIDGAGVWAQFRFVTWPLLQPLLVPAIIIRSIFAFNQFYLFYVMQPPLPVTTLATVSFFVFNYGGQFAVSAAVNVFTVIVLVVLILWFNRRSKALEGVTYV